MSPDPIGLDLARPYTVYHLLKYHVQYQALGVEAFERQHRERDLKALRKKASKLGFTLVESLPTPATA